MKKINNKTKRKIRNRKKLKSVNANRYRISVTKSLNNIFAQIIDDKQNKTLVSASSIEKEIKSKKVKKMDRSSLTGEIFLCFLDNKCAISLNLPLLCVPIKIFFMSI